MNNNVFITNQLGSIVLFAEMNWNDYFNVTKYSLPYISILFWEDTTEEEKALKEWITDKTRN